MSQAYIFLFCSNILFQIIQSDVGFALQLKLTLLEIMEPVLDLPSEEVKLNTPLRDSNLENSTVSHLFQ